MAKRFGLLYSRYADDITFSSMHYVYAEDGEFIAELNRIIADNHFVINAKKVRLQKTGMRQEVTGLVVTDKVNVVRKYVRELKTIIHIWERYGYMAATQSLLNHRKHNRTYIKSEATFSLESVVAGKLNYLKMVKGEGDSVYMKLYTRYVALSNEIHSRVNKFGHSRSIVYKHTMEIVEFEKKVATRLSYADGVLSFNLRSEKYNVVVSSNIDQEILVQHLSSGKRTLLANYQISLCSNGVGLFYMLHKRYCEPMGSREKQLQQELNDIVNSEAFNEVLGGVIADIDLCDIVELSELEDLNSELANAQL
jgi:hypothetical protein